MGNKELGMKHHNACGVSQLLIRGDKLKYNYSNTISFCEIDSKIFILNETTNQFFSLDKVGFLLWKKIIKLDLFDCIKEIAEHYNQPTVKIEKDIAGFVEKLVQYGLLVESNE